MNKLKKCITKQKKKVIGLGITAALLAATLAPALTTEASWIHNNTGWWWSEENGYPANEWRYINGEWYWFDATGYMATGWRNVGGTWYYMDASGAMATGWRNVGGTWYYMDASGAMATGWRNVGGTWYYMDASGAMATGWRNVGGTWYYMDASGAMATGWRNVGGTWYYMDASGAMQTGWQNIGETWYYMYDDGAMASNTWIGNYYVNENGKFDESSKENNTNSSGGSTNSGSNSSTQAHTHTWVTVPAQTHTVNHPAETHQEDQGWDEEIKGATHWVCGCGADFTSVKALHDHQGSYADNGDFSHPGNSHTYIEPSQWVHHENWVTVVDREAWVETVVDVPAYQKCSVCGATK